jgi:hypothetical protein
MKALNLMKSSTSTDDRADSYVVTIKRNLQKKIIDTLLEQIEKIEDKKRDLQEFAMEADANRGIIALTREQCEKRFEQIIDLNYELDLVRAELKSKQASFDYFFGEEVDK